MNRYLLPVLTLLAVALALLAPAAATADRRVSNAAPGRSSRATTLALARRDERNLSAAQPGTRNLFDLTRRLTLHSLAPINPYARATAPDYRVGRVDTFWVAQDTNGYVAMKATLLLKTPHAYWYVQQRMGIPSAKLMPLLRKSAQQFETRIYPTDRAVFGPEPPLGPDHDPRITVLNANLPGAGTGGYYSAEDLYPRTVNPYSNGRKMLYISITAFQLGTADYASGIAHELQHMIHWYRHRSDGTWINEGSSMLAQVLTGNTADGYDAEFASRPGTQVNSSCEDTSANYAECTSDLTAYYGAAFQWMLYFYQHYGGDRALQALLAARGTSDMGAFDAVLARLGSHDSARDMFRKWVVANLVDDPRLDGGAYGYRRVYQGCCIAASVTTTTNNYPYTRNAAVDQFATDYVELRPGGAPTLHVRFSGGPTVSVVPNVPIQDGMEWWSNRGDEMDSTLTRTLDLRHVAHAVLSYDIWYNVETDFDYGYVEVSTDGGKTWRTLRGRYTTDRDPNGANYGNGYTGLSGKVAGNRGGWLHDSIDLSAYSGRRVQVRFEQITDDAFNLSGLTLDNIRVAGTGFTDAPGVAGWQAHGWVRIANILPTHWLVQAILYTNQGVQVREMPLTSGATGELTIGGLGRDVRRVVLAISPTAPQTTIPSHYVLTVR